jgi:hypothetical protein
MNAGSFSVSCDREAAQGALGASRAASVLAHSAIDAGAERADPGAGTALEADVGDAVAVQFDLAATVDADAGLDRTDRRLGSPAGADFGGATNESTGVEVGPALGIVNSLTTNMTPLAEKIRELVSINLGCLDLESAPQGQAAPSPPHAGAQGRRQSHISL